MARLRGTLVVLLGWLSASLVAIPSAAQQLLWAQSLHGAGGAQALLGDGRMVTRAMAVDGQGNVAVTGSTAAGGHTNFLTTKLAGAGGAVAWQSVYDGPAALDDDAEAIAFDAFGNVVIAGQSHDASGNTDVVVIKYATANGSQVWKATWDGGTSDFAFGVAVDPAGDVIVAAESGNASGNNDVVILKYGGTTGALVWQRAIDTGSDDYIADLALDRSGNALVCGFSWNAAGNFDMGIAKVGKDGTTAWTKAYDGGADDVAYGIAVDASGNAIVTGYSTTSSGANIETLKFTSAGALAWRAEAGSSNGDFGAAVAVDSGGNALVAGQFANAQGTADFATIKFASSDGKIVWKKTLDLGGPDHAYAIAVDGADNAIVAGSAYNGANFDWKTVAYSASQGELLWAKGYGGSGGGDDNALSVVASAGAAYVAGTSLESGATIGVRVAKIEDAAPSRSLITSPVPGSAIGAASATFTWTEGSGVTERYLQVGTTAGGSEIYAGYQGNRLSRAVAGLPAAADIHVRLLSWINGGWQWDEYLYPGSAGTAAAPPAKSAMTSPPPGSSLSSSATFTWTAGSGVTERYLSVGTVPGAADIYGGYQGAALAKTVSGLPTNGRTIHVRLLSWISGAWQWNDYTYQASGGATSSGPAKSSITSPAPGATLGAAVTFAWDAGNGVTERYLQVGTSPGAGDIYAGYQGSALSRTVSGLPSSGIIYVRLMSWISGRWHWNDYRYSASPS